MTNATHARFLPRALPVRSTAATGDARSQVSETDRPAHRSQCGTAPLRSRGAIVRRSSADLLGQATGAARRATHGNEPAGFHADRIRARCRRGVRAVVACFELRSRRVGSILLGPSCAPAIRRDGPSSAMSGSSDLRSIADICSRYDRRAHCRTSRWASRRCGVHFRLTAATRMQANCQPGLIGLCAY